MPRFGCLIAVILCLPGGLAADELADLQVVVYAINDVLEHEKVGGSVSWTGADLGKSGLVTVTKTFLMADGTPCRAYTRTTGNGSLSGTGCRKDIEFWQLDESRFLSGENQPW